MISKAKSGDLTPWLEASGGASRPGAYRGTSTGGQGSARHGHAGRRPMPTAGSGSKASAPRAGRQPDVRGARTIAQRRSCRSRRGGWTRSRPAASGTMLRPGFLDSIHGADLPSPRPRGRPSRASSRTPGRAGRWRAWTCGATSFAGSDFVGTTTLKDQDRRAGPVPPGRACPRARGTNLLIVPNDDQPYLMQEVDVPDPPGVGAGRVEIGLHRGIWIEGKAHREGDREAGARGLAALPAVPGEHLRPGDPRIRQRRHLQTGPASRIAIRPRPTAPTGWSGCPAGRSSGPSSHEQGVSPGRRLRAIKG